MNRNSVGWFEIYVQDIARAKAFYEAVLRVQLQRLPKSKLEIWSFPSDANIAGAGGALVRMEGFPSGGNSVLVYFTCEDCAVEEGRVKSNGGRVQKAKESIGEYGFISLVYDTEGNMFGLHSMQ